MRLKKIITTLLILLIFASEIPRIYQLVVAHDPNEINEGLFDHHDIHLPQGYKVITFAAGLFRPTSIAFGDDGWLYIAQQDGLILRAIDLNEDGISDRVSRFAHGFDQPLGIAFRGDKLYVSSRTMITIVKDTNRDGTADIRIDIIKGLPSLGNHQNNGIAFGPEGHLYICQGSSTNLGPEPTRMNASILRAKPDGSELTVFASGLRNTYDLTFTSTGDLFVTDNGADDPIFNPPDELNHIIRGEHYGFPKYHGIAPPESGTISPIVEFPSHSAPTGIAEWLNGNLFVTLWNDLPDAKRIVQVQLFKKANSYEAKTKTFATGFNHPIDVTVSPENHLFVADYTGTIYRITADEAIFRESAKAQSVNPKGKLAVSWGKIKRLN